jgi:anti-sigma regulatory factor (Ser/Thr protein kinase)
VITRQQIRAVVADGGRVIDPAGRPVGRIMNVFLGVRTSEPWWLTVDPDGSGGTETVVPLAGARLVDGCVQVQYTAADVRGAPGADGPFGRLGQRREQEVRRYYAALDDAARDDLSPGENHSQRGTTTGQPRVRTRRSTPVVGGSHGNHPSVRPSITAQAISAGRGVIPVIAGLDVRAGDDDTVAYPATPDGPWTPVSTSSAGPGWSQCRQWRWPSVPTSIRAMRLELRPVLDLTGLPEDVLDDLLLAAGEAASNAVEHARSPRLPFFDVLGDVGEGRARIVIQDHGHWRIPAGDGGRGRGLHMIGVLSDATLTLGSQGTTVVLRNRSRSSR